MAQAPFIINPAIVAIAIDYQGINNKARGYVADAVAPRIKIDAPLFRYPVYDINSAFTVVDAQIDRLGRANELGYAATEQTGATLDWMLAEPVPYRDQAAAIAQSVSFDLKARAARNVVDKIALAREIRVATLAMSTSSYSAGYVVDLSTGTKWSDFNNSDPVAAIVDARQTMLIPGNVGVCSQRVMNILARHPKVAVALGGSQNSGKYYSPQEVAMVLGLDRIIVGNTIKQTSKRGQTLTTGNVWTDSFAIHYQGPTGPDGLGMDIASPNFLTTFQWGDIVAYEEQFVPGNMGLWGGVKVKTGESLVEKAVAPFAGFLFNAVL